MDNELDSLLSTWTETLLGNLDDPTTRGAIDAPQDAISAIWWTSSSPPASFPTDLDHDFIDAVALVLSGLSKVVVTSDDLRKALFPSGSPATLSGMKKRFEEYLDEKAKGMDPAKVRIVIE